MNEMDTLRFMKKRFQEAEKEGTIERDILIEIKRIISSAEHNIFRGINGAMLCDDLRWSAKKCSPKTADFIERTTAECERISEERAAYICIFDDSSMSESRKEYLRTSSCTPEIREALRNPRTNATLKFSDSDMMERNKKEGLFLFVVNVPLSEVRFSEPEHECTWEGTTWMICETVTAVCKGRKFSRSAYLADVPASVSGACDLVDLLEETIATADEFGSLNVKEGKMDDIISRLEGIRMEVKGMVKELDEAFRREMKARSEQVLKEYLESMRNKPEGGGEQ